MNQSGHKNKVDVHELNQIYNNFQILLYEL